MTTKRAPHPDRCEALLRSFRQRDPGRVLPGVVGDPLVRRRNRMRSFVADAPQDDRMGGLSRRSGGQGITARPSPRRSGTALPASRATRVQRYFSIKLSSMFRALSRASVTSPVRSKNPSKGTRFRRSSPLRQRRSTLRYCSRARATASSQER